MIYYEKRSCFKYVMLLSISQSTNNTPKRVVPKAESHLASVYLYFVSYIFNFFPFIWKLYPYAWESNNCKLKSADVAMALPRIV
jgi:hypothetical protein